MKFLDAENITLIDSFISQNNASIFFIKKFNKNFKAKFLMHSQSGNFILISSIYVTNNTIEG